MFQGLMKPGAFISSYGSQLDSTCTVPTGWRKPGDDGAVLQRNHQHSEGLPVVAFNHYRVVFAAECDVRVRRIARQRDHGDSPLRAHFLHKEK